ncbi:hypothetical protein HMPREF9442_00616 [Paraprevotella xylaniphila YIT 11841]|uniref:Uncharacterized protein n=1 Tax=Paraprevotella xylaniphila YIT 11841 TaxID=762982 RepID=F3QR22_9BACT|nr:hypothetical protein HMPREF9442_00616 [Paraprevotella xylaniphila YIT 11841]
MSFLFCFYWFEIHAKIAFQHKTSNKSAYKIHKPLTCQQKRQP